MNARRGMAIRGLLAAAALVALTGCTPAANTPNAQLPAPTTAVLTQAEHELASLTVLAHVPTIAGYDRSCKKGHACSFGPAWTDATTAPGGHNGCPTRSDLLDRWLEHKTMKTTRSGGRSSCTVIAGVLADPYTGTSIRWSKSHAAAVQIDHIVPLALAYDLGASRWSPAARAAYANDETHVLIVASGPRERSQRRRGAEPVDAAQHGGPLRLRHPLHPGLAPLRPGHRESRPRRDSPRPRALSPGRVTAPHQERKNAMTASAQPAGAAVSPTAHAEACRHLYDCECAAHTAHATGNERWITAADRRLHEAIQTELALYDGAGASGPRR